MSVWNNELPIEQQIKIILEEWLLGNKKHRAILVRLYDDSENEEEVNTKVINAETKNSCCKEYWASVAMKPNTSVRWLQKSLKTRKEQQNEKRSVLQERHPLYSVP